MSLVSIVISTYNQERTVLETLDSTRTSGVPDAEIIVCDDCSTDGTRGAIDNWIQKAENRSVHLSKNFHKANIGICRNLTSGCLAATGKYVKMIGGDDFLVPGSLKTMLDSMELENLLVAFGRPTYIVEDSSFSFSQDSYQAMLRNFARFDRFNSQEQFRALLKINRVFSPCAIVERKSLLKMLPATRPFVMLEDWPLWLEYARSGVRIRYLDIEFVKYRVHSNNISRVSRQKRRRSPYGSDISRLIALNRRRMPFWRIRDMVEMELSHLKLKRELSLEILFSLAVKTFLCKLFRKLIYAIDGMSVVDNG